MAGTTNQTQQQRGQDTSVNDESVSSRDVVRDLATRTSREGDRLTVSESRRAAALQRQIEEGFESLQKQGQHADLQISFKLTISGLDPTKIHQL